jgi:hypothetical protein
MRCVPPPKRAPRCGSSAGFARHGRGAAVGGGQIGLHPRAGGLDLDAREGTEELHLADRAAGPRLRRAAQRDALGPQHGLGVAGERARGFAVEHVGSAHELRHEAGGRCVVHLARRAHLLQPAGVEDADAVAHRQRFMLVVGDEQERDGQPPLQRLQLALHLLAQLQVERAQRLVQQQHLRLADQRAGQGHALALAARQLPRPALAHAGQLHQRQQFVSPP